MKERKAENKKGLYNKKDRKERKKISSEGK
jgi:hypothetical protein